jgi:6,7-dimethyl-8-ribityllumazine synthase
MNKILIVRTSWYNKYIEKMLDLSSTILKEESLEIDFAQAPGALELAALAKNKIAKDSRKYSGVLFLGIVIRGETTHYDLVTNETFRCISDLSMEFSDISFINTVICVENENQLKERFEKSTINNSKALISLINEKSGQT